MFSLLVVSFAVITLVFDAQTAPLIDSDRLPGLDEIESGSDIVGLFSGSDKKSKFRIFDLSEESLYPFKINAGGNERVYKTPRDAQITKISLRREVNCEDLSNSFGQFYSNYFRSNQIPGGRPFFFFQMFNSYPETLKKIYESMTKEAKSVGTSTSWWGLYSIQLAPPFILNFAVYQPPVVQTVEGKTEYQSWLAYAPQEPVVVNRTLAPLSNLFYRYPQVQAHLQRTIGYYLAKGDLPTLTQLQL
ncbi:unnamed protein product [Rotaria sordida]|uniref:MACPF domain-containing protein n=1 Tax=Rotaria sordida TaxID=392033 RepID=A0A815RXX8_9BILA|nr:unnamed protein product [Rotaria sordida]